VSDGADRVAARAAWADAHAAAAALAASGRLGPELTEALAVGVVPLLAATLADLDDGLPLDVIAGLSAPLDPAVAALAGPLGLAPALRPVHADVVRGLAALSPRSGPSRSSAPAPGLAPRSPAA
jgi:hypothetical protein